MEAILIAAVVVGVWIVLVHIRKQRFLKEYLELQRQALEKGVTLPGDLPEAVSGKTDWAAVSLRLGVLSLVLGITGVVIGMLILPSLTWDAKDVDTNAIFASFWVVGLLLAAFGIGNLVCWLLIDRKRGKKNG
ncbi:MAG: hypothetical protein FJY80_12360 [Candidatus Aminicenantes bacterium]|nr:hypothetical protein [Candidatus Aminicenantes bacterium]